MIKKSIISISFFLAISLFLCSTVTSQELKSVNWITFEQLDDSLQVKPKKVFISFYADWCVYCKKMKKTAFRDQKIINLLNKEYYAVSMDAESKETIIFDGATYVNQNIGKTRRPTHQIPLLLASRKNKPFSLPVNLILDETFKIKGRYYEYLSPKKLLKLLKE